MSLTLDQLDAKARGILIDNDRGGYTIPTSGLYPYQWNWDSVFAAYGFATFDMARAWREMRSLFSGQWENGMVPHILFHKESRGYYPGPDIWAGIGPIASSGVTQPPVAATFIRKMYEAAPAEGARHLRDLFPKLKRWHGWFMKHRLHRDAVCVTHPWESGRDNAPDWDGAMRRMVIGELEPYTRADTAHVDPSMRPTKFDYDRFLWLVKLGREARWDEVKLAEAPAFRVADPTMSFTLLRANRDLEVIAAHLGEDGSEIAGWIARLELGCQTLWDPDLGAYTGRDALTGAFSGALSNASFLCWYAGLGNAQMLAHLRRVLSEVSYGVPSHDPSAEGFDARRYWRGPVWAIMNTMIGLGLAKAGHAEEAETIRAQTARLISDHGFAEYYDPLTGAPAGGHDFTWTAAVWLAWVRKENGRD
ncbi:MAG: hypothetical protein AAF982_07205 [Pseudomonadota bacterium]